MHRSYKPQTPCTCKYLKYRWDRSHYEGHRKKVSAAKPYIDDNPPKIHIHHLIKLKKLQMEKERLMTIERDNRLLLQKVSCIMRYGGRVDNFKHDYSQKSLNKSKGQQELLRVTRENLAILKRITSRQPNYNHVKWISEHQMNQQFSMNISKYPNIWKQTYQDYESHRMQQLEANQRIRRQVESNSNNDAGQQKKSVDVA